METLKEHMINVVDFGPKKITKDTPFNVQANGDSAIWFKLRGAQDDIQIILNGCPLITEFQNDIISAIVPEFFFHFATELTVLLKSKKTSESSKPIKIPIVAQHPAPLKERLFKNQSSHIQYLTNLLYKERSLSRGIVFRGWGLTTIHHSPWNEASLKSIAFRLRHGDESVEKVFSDLSWRHYIVEFCIRYVTAHANHKPLRLVECGVEDGKTAFTACNFLEKEYPETSYDFHLFDSWDTIREQDLKSSEAFVKKIYAGQTIDLVKENLEPFSVKNKIYFKKGYIPESFSISPAIDDHVSYLHIDLNNAKATVDCLEYFYPKMSANSIILFDDYGWIHYEDTRNEIDRFFKSKPGVLQVLPTSQAIYFIDK